jgi:orotidine-5'-phosphate decarboxylase
MSKVNNGFFGSKVTGLIFAADLPTTSQNYRVLDKIIDYVDVVKLSSFLAFAEGIGIISQFKQRYGKPVFADFKVADVPHTNRKIVEILRNEGVDAIMLHTITGPDSIEECLMAADDKVGIILQTELTNPGGLIFTSPIAEDMARLAAEMPVFGIQAPGNRPDKIRMIRSIVGVDKIVVCCGVGAQGGVHGSVMTAGGTYSIVGRAIYEADDPLQATKSILSTADSS